MAELSNSTIEHVNLERNLKELTINELGEKAYDNYVDDDEEELGAEEFISLMEHRAAMAEAAINELRARKEKEKEKEKKDGVPKRKVRMPNADVNFILSMKGEELGGMEYLDSMSHLYTPEQMEEMWRKDNDEMEARHAQIIKELSEKGYVEADEDYLDSDEELSELSRIQWESFTAASERRHSERQRIRVAATGKEDDEVEGFAVIPYYLDPWKKHDISAQTTFSN